MKNLQIFILFLGLANSFGANGQSQELQQLALNTQKLAQFKQILRDMKSGYQIISQGYGTIKDISEGNFNLHKAFLDGLLNVSPNVRKYKRVADIVKYQGMLVSEYQNAFKVFKGSKFYTGEEIAYLDKVYGNLLKQSVRNLAELASVLTPGQLRMSDDERIKEIDRIYQDMEAKLSFLRHFNNQTKILGIQRAKVKNELDAVGSLYGIKN